MFNEIIPGVFDSGSYNALSEYLIAAFNFLQANTVLYVLLTLTLVFGSINWVIWFVRRTRSINYIPIKGSYEASTSVVIPVYNETYEVLKDTVDSVLKNRPDEVILILDHTEAEIMKSIKAEYKDKVKCHFIIEPGKRPALAKGINLSKGDIVVLVDSDTRWVGENFLKNLIVPFKDPKVGGVGTRQKVKERSSWGQRIIDWVLDLKYSDYIKSDSLSGSVLCLSGRTAAYRREILLPELDKLTEERFLWHKCQGGDDARLTTLVLMQGYNTVYQDTSLAKTSFDRRFIVYLRQKIRWSRNSFRTYLKSIFSAWPWKQKRFYYLMSAYHTLVPGLLFLLSMAFVIYSVYLQLYILAYIWIIWAFLSRIIKGFSHLRKEPSAITLLPIIVFFYFFLSFIKLYAFLTMTRERWSGSRKNYRIKNGIRIGGENEQLY